MPKRRAVIVGIDHYSIYGDLSGCVADAHAMKDLLDRHGPLDIDKQDDRDSNFNILDELVSTHERGVTERSLNMEISSLFSKDENYEVALLYFAGHGYIDGVNGEGGRILASDSERDGGITMTSILNRVRDSNAIHKVIIFDSCFSGDLGNVPFVENGALIPDRAIIITASTGTQTAKEKSGRGVFTSLFCEAARGSAGDLLGKVTPTMVFAQVYQAMSAMKQTPVLKANVDDFLVLRKNRPDFTTSELRGLKTHFLEEKKFTHPLSPEYEPRNEGRESWMPVSNSKKVAVFKLLQKFNRKGLVVPLDHQGNEIANMWDAAMLPFLEDAEDVNTARYGACRLTPFGKYYRDLNP